MKKKFSEMLLEGLTKASDFEAGQVCFFKNRNSELYVCRINAILPEMNPRNWVEYRENNRKFRKGGVLVDFFSPSYKIERRNCWKRLIINIRGYQLFEISEIESLEELRKTFIDSRPNIRKQIEFFRGKQLKRLRK